MVAERRTRSPSSPWHEKLGADELNDAMIGAGYYVYGWEDTAAAFAEVRHQHDGSPMLTLSKQGDFVDDLDTPNLLVNETKDAATPYSGALEVRRYFPSSSLIAGVGGTTHAGSMSGVSCSDGAITAYLTGGTVPSGTSGVGYDLGCPPVPAPGDQPAQRGSRNVWR